MSRLSIFTILPSKWEISHHGRARRPRSKKLLQSSWGDFTRPPENVNWNLEVLVFPFPFDVEFAFPIPLRS